MKKILGLLVVLMLGINVLGQRTIKNISEIQRTETQNNTIEDFLLNGGDIPSVRDVHFVKEGNLFLLAYEPYDKDELPYGFYKGNRNIYLYRKNISDVNNPWEIASGVVMTNYIIDNNNYCEVDFFLNNEETANASIGNVEFENDLVKITVGFSEWRNGHYTSVKPIPKTFTFIPIGNDSYLVKQ